LIRQAIEQQIGGTISHDWGTAGLTVTVLVPAGRLSD
jgi:hypothetical protein